MKILKTIYRYIGIIISSFIGSGLILSAYSNLISPNILHYATYLSLGFHIILWINVVILVFWAIQKNKILFIPLVAIVLSIGATYRYFPLNIYDNKYSGGDTIKVLTYNTCCFSKMHPHTKDNPNPIIEYINNLEADVVCLQEYAMGRAKNSLREAELVKAFREKYPYRKIFLNNNSYYESGLACLSKYPIVEAKPIIYPKNTNGSIICSIDVKGKTIKFIINHLESNRLSSHDRELLNYATSHLSESDSLMNDVKQNIVRKIANAARRRANQADSIANYIKNLDEYTVVCGDFNDTEQSYAYNKIRGDLNDAYIDNCFGPAISYHTDKFYFRIDHMLYGSGLVPLHTKIDNSIKDSDHYPIITTFEIKE